MKELKKGNHELSTHAKITGVTYHVNPDDLVDMVHIEYKEGQVKDGKFIPIGNYDKRFLRQETPIKGMSMDYDRELAESEENNAKLDGFSKASSKVKWAEDEL